MTDICSQCGEMFEAEKDYGFIYPVFCSSECREKFMKNEKERLRQGQIKKIPEHFRELKTFRKQELETAFKNRESLFITGERGVGKTVFLCALLKLYILDGQKVKFVSLPDWIFELQSAWDKKDDIYSYSSDVWKFKGVLGIDDLGRRTATLFAQDILYILLNHREQNNLKVFITSNMTLDEIADQIDDRIASRISGICRVLKFEGEDRRISK